MRVEYSYDAWGNRVETLTDLDGDDFGYATILRLAQDGWNPSKPAPVGLENFDVWADIDDESDLLTRYFRGDRVDQLFGRDEGDGTPYWTLTDHLGSVREVLDNSANIKDAISYDAFGNLTDSDEDFRGRYGFTGREIEKEVELQSNRERFYDPATARWTSKDPMAFDAGDSNLYRYVKNQTCFKVDPSGLQFIWPLGSGDRRDGSDDPRGPWRGHGHPVEIREPYGIDFVRTGILGSLVKEKLSVGRGALLFETEKPCIHGFEGDPKRMNWSEEKKWGKMYGSQYIENMMGWLLRDGGLHSVIEIHAHADYKRMFNEETWLDERNASVIGKQLGSVLTNDGIIVLSGCNAGLMKENSFVQLIANGSQHKVYAAMGYVDGNFLNDGSASVSTHTGLGREPFGWAPYYPSKVIFGSYRDIYRVFKPN